jgi:hypothetical protein
MTKLMTIVALVVTLISASTFTASAGPFSRTHSTAPAKHRKDSL